MGVDKNQDTRVNEVVKWHGLNIMIETITPSFSGQIIITIL